MKRILVIGSRELSSYFFSPIAYVAMAIFLVGCGFLFSNDFRPGQPAGMRTIFEWMVWLLVFIVPVLSMSLLSQEWSSGTIETLITAPVEDHEVVLGKFMGSLGFMFTLLLPTVLYVMLLRIYGQPDYGPIFSGYLGIILVSSLFVSIGLFCSSLTRSQIVAAVLAAAILFLVTIVPWWVGGKATLPAFWRTVVDQGVFKRYTDFAKGVLDSGNLVFFVVTTAVFLFLTTKVLESRRWK